MASLLAPLLCLMSSNIIHLFVSFKLLNSFWSPSVFVLIFLCIARLIWRWIPSGIVSWTSLHFQGSLAAKGQFKHTPPGVLPCLNPSFGGFLNLFSEMSLLCSLAHRLQPLTDHCVFIPGVSAAIYAEQLLCKERWGLQIPREKEQVPWEAHSSELSYKVNCTCGNQAVDDISKKPP